MTSPRQDFYSAGYQKGNEHIDSWGISVTDVTYILRIDPRVQG